MLFYLLIVLIDLDIYDLLSYMIEQWAEMDATHHGKVYQK